VIASDTAAAAPLLRRHRYRLLTFDLDETLWPCMPVIEAAEAQLYHWLQRVAPRLTATHTTTTLRQQRQQLAQQQPDIAHDVTALRHRSLTQLLQQFGYPTTLADEAQQRFQRARNRVEPFADVIPVLHQLRHHHTLIALTNGNAEVAQTPLADYFDHAFTAAAVGAAKPAPNLFHAAITQAGVTAATTLHIGDDPALDCDAARQIGIDAVWVNRRGHEWPNTLPPPRHTITELHALAAWLS